jgi:hypothetical protein
MPDLGKPRSPAERYGDEQGSEALARQRQASKDHHVCCGEWKDGPHHEACKNYVPDELPPVIDGQESLI